MNTSSFHITRTPCYNGPIAAIEAIHGPHRVVIDVGWAWIDPECSPLDHRTADAYDRLIASEAFPDVAGLYPGDDRPMPDALIVAAPQRDVTGLRHLARPEVPVHAAQEIIGEATGGMKTGRLARNAGRSSPPPTILSPGRGLTIPAGEGGAIRVLSFRFPHDVHGSLALHVTAGNETALIVQDAVKGGLPPEELERFLDAVPDHVSHIYARAPDRVPFHGMDLTAFEAGLRECLREAWGLATVVGSRAGRGCLTAVARAAQATGRRLIIDPFTLDDHPWLGDFPGLRLAWGSRPGGVSDISPVDGASLRREPAAYLHFSGAGGWRWLAALHPGLVPALVINTLPLAWMKRIDLETFLCETAARGSTVKTWSLLYGNGLAPALRKRYPHATVTWWTSPPYL